MTRKILFGNNISGTGKMYSKTLRPFHNIISHCSNTFTSIREHLKAETYDALFFFISSDSNELRDFIKEIHADFPELKICPLLYSDYEHLAEKLISMGAFMCFELPISVDVFSFYVISKFFEMDNIAVPYEVSKFLIEKKVPSHTKGFYFLAACIEAVVDNPEMLGNASRILYPYVVKRTSATSTAWIERAIRNLSEMSFRNNIYFRYYPEESRLSTKVFIKAISDEYRKVRDDYDADPLDGVFYN